MYKYHKTYKIMQQLELEKHLSLTDSEELTNYKILCFIVNVMIIDQLYNAIEIL